MRNRPASTPTATVRAHIEPYVTAGYPYPVIATAAGVSAGTVVNVMRERRPTVKAGTATALLAVGWGDLTRHAHHAAKVPTTGSQRRIQALALNGWTLEHIADRAGLDRNTITRIVGGYQTRVLATTAQAIEAVFADLWDKPPQPTTAQGKREATRARTVATRHGYAPALAWDSIDNPAETPNVGEDGGLGSGRRLIHIEDVEWLLSRDAFTWEGLAARMGVSRSTLERHLYQHGRLDLTEQLYTNTRGYRKATAA